jgi:hypothetical protein
LSRSFARDHNHVVDRNDNSPSINSSSLGFEYDAYSYSNDPHAGLPSQPTLIYYRTGKEKCSPPKGPEAYRRLKELCEVFTHPIVEVWNEDLGWKVVSVMDAHRVR